MAVFHLDHHENDIRPVSIDTAWNFACGTVSDDAWSVDHITACAGSHAVHVHREMQYNIERIQDFLTMKELPEPSVYANINSYDVKLENVHFSYTGEEKDEVLHGIDLTIPAGSFTALVGPSGGGKSTVARLISRFWDVTSGSITIGGVNIKEIPLL